MYFSFLWYWPVKDQVGLLRKSIDILQEHGAVLVGQGELPDQLVLRFEFSSRADEPSNVVLQTLNIRTVVHPDRDLVMLDLWCYETVIYPENQGRQNLQKLVAMGDTIFNVLQPWFGHSTASGEPLQGLDGFLRNGLPLCDQFVYMSPEVLARVRLSAERLELYRHEHDAHLTQFPNGGFRVENRANGYLSPLDLV